MRLNIFGLPRRQPRHRDISLDEDETQGMLVDENQSSPKPNVQGKLSKAKIVAFFTASIDLARKTSTDHHLSTSSLDGLRGYAALAVMNYHILYAYQSFVFYGYGLSQAASKSCARPEDVYAHNRWFHQLPVFRMAYGGTWPISAFFVISGFALSHRPLKVSRDAADGFTSGASAVASGLFRRAFRLYGPPLIATFITMVLIQLGAYEHGRKVSGDTNWVPVINEAHHKRFDSFGLQLGDWLHETWKMFHVFWWGDLHNQYDVHLWTIPTEFRCSLAIFLVLPMYISLRVRVRRVVMVLLIIFVYKLDRWDVALFYSGLLIADTSIDWQQRLKKSLDGSAAGVSSAMVRSTILALSLLLLSAPDFCISETPAYRILSSLIPSSDPAPFRFIPNLGGIILVALVAHTAPSNLLVATLLNSSIPQYLGRIRYWLFPTMWNLTGHEEPWRYVIGFLAAYGTFLAVAVIVADLFWRAIDSPSVRFAKAVHGKVMRE
ncbi:hypothetical protein ACCO45_002812 [Purpureocillium lilacinum]|uniref:Uncharacterized protein n=1 Tax=Purpureocillium lilacinum TaxID=33203 RepID=A0ACC4E0H7_PURLI